MCYTAADANYAKNKQEKVFNRGKTVMLQSLTASKSEV